MEVTADWRTEARTLLASNYGPAEAARKLGVPYERLKKWAQRAGIKTLVPIVSPLPPPALKRVPNVPTAATVIQGDAERLGPEARHTSARIAHKRLLHIERAGDQDEEAGLVLLDAALTAGKLLQTANAKGWERQPDQRHAGLVNIAILGIDPASLRVQCTEGE